MVQSTKLNLAGSAVIMSKRKLTGNLPFRQGTAAKIYPPPHAHTGTPPGNCGNFGEAV